MPQMRTPRATQMRRRRSFPDESGGAAWAGRGDARICGGNGNFGMLKRRWNVFLSFLLLSFHAATTTAQSTSFAVPVSLLGAGVDDFKFSMDNGWAILFSLENVYYDEFYTCTPKQAFRVTDVNGDALQPFAIPARDPENYVLDMSFLKTGAGLKPFFRGDELVDSTLRAWRIDYYKDGLGTDVYTTVMSGVAVPIAERTFMLRVDLGLHWEIEGDAINRLQQGLNTHIALAIADFQSFTLVIDADESAGSLVADVRTTTVSTTPPATTSEAVSTTVDIPSTGEWETTTGNAVSTTAPTLDTTTQFGSTTTVDWETSTVGSTTTTKEGETPRYDTTGTTPKMATKDNDSIDRETEPPFPVSTPSPPVPGPATFPPTGTPVYRDLEAECEHHLHGKHGKKKGKKGKKAKKTKKGKLSPYEECLLGKGKKGKKKHGAFLSKKSKAQRSGFYAAICMIFVTMAAAVTLVTRHMHREDKWQQQYDAIDMMLAEPAGDRGPVVPIPLRAFGTFPKGKMNVLDLDAAVASMRMPPPRKALATSASPLRQFTMETNLDDAAKHDAYMHSSTAPLLISA